MNIYTEADWRKIIYRGVESDELDYKAAQNWNKLSRAGKAKFVRHCLAMANTKGGYVVVGVGEDSSGRPVNYTGLTEEESSSFDPTDVGSFISRFSDPPVDFTLERPVVDGKRYAVFVIRCFTDLPHVCPAGCGAEEELRQGVFYIRTPDASSRPAFRSVEIHGLILRALRNQREMLSKVIRGVLYENRSIFDEQSRSRYQEELLHSRSFYRKKAHLPAGNLFFEFRAFPLEYTEQRFLLSELKNAAESAAETKAWTLFFRKEQSLPAYSTNVSCRFLNDETTSYWQLFQSGFFHRVLPVREKEGHISLHTLIALSTEFLQFAAALYSELLLPEKMIHFSIVIAPAEGVILDVPGEKSGMVCRIPEIEVRREISRFDLANGLEEQAVQLVHSLCSRFNMPDEMLAGLRLQIIKILENRA